MADQKSSTYAGPERVFSGVQPSGSLHLGNYLGALKKFAALQHENDCVFCIVDLHAITVPQDPAKLADQTREIAAAYFAAGVDPKKAIVYARSPPCAPIVSWRGILTAWPAWGGSTA